MRAADRHYLTDVAAGAAAGTAIGPLLLHPHLRRRLEVVPTGRGISAVGTF